MPTMTHDSLVKAAKAAVLAIFHDQSVGPSQSIASLEDVREDMDEWIAALREDLHRTEKEEE